MEALGRDDLLVFMLQGFLSFICSPRTPLYHFKIPPPCGCLGSLEVWSGSYIRVILGLY